MKVTEVAYSYGLRDVTSLPCPECGDLLTVARIFDASLQEAFTGVACLPCDLAFRVIDLPVVEQPTLGLVVS